MPLLIDNVMEQITPIKTNYRYSGTKIEELGSSEYTLVNLVVDVSGSVFAFKDELEKCLISVVKGCAYSPRANNLLLRLVLFNETVVEVHGYKELSFCNENDYVGVVIPGGQTALIDSAHETYSVTADYGTQLKNNKYKANAITVYITDGYDNSSSHTSCNVALEAEKLVSDEVVESHLSILVGVNVNDQVVSKKLNEFRSDAKIDQYVEIDKADSKTLAKLANFVVNSVSSQSQSLGTGQKSQALVF